MRRNKVSKKNTARRHRPLQLRLPATSANLGPAFDAAALALDLYLKLDARPAADFSITASGRDREICERLQDHLILNTYREVLCAQGREVTPLSLRIQNEIPIGKGCGSSAAARLAGIALASPSGGGPINRVGPQRPAGALFESGRGRQRAELHAAACRLHPRTS